MMQRTQQPPVHTPASLSRKLLCLQPCCLSGHHWMMTLPRLSASDDWWPHSGVDPHQKDECNIARAVTTHYCTLGGLKQRNLCSYSSEAGALKSSSKGSRKILSLPHTVSGGCQQSLLFFGFMVFSLCLVFSCVQI